MRNHNHERQSLKENALKSCSLWIKRYATSGLVCQSDTQQQYLKFLWLRVNWKDLLDLEGDEEVHASIKDLDPF